jgi:hypothetical protein
MQGNALKLIGSSLIVLGLIGGGFVAGGMSSGKSSADPAPTPTPAFQVLEDPIVPTPTPAPEDQGSYEPLQGEEETPANSAQLPLPLPGTPQQPAPEQPAPATPIDPTPAPPVEPTPNPVSEPLNEAPYVVSTTPTDHAVGVEPDSRIYVLFSEIMDTAKTEAAFEVSTGNCGDINWKFDTMIIFTPCQPWAYGTEVTVRVKASAADADGKAMEKAFETSFRVLRQSTAKIYSEAARDGHVFVPGISPAPTPYADAAQTTITLLNYTRGFLSFHLDDLPEDLVKVESARVYAKQASHSAKAYGPETGPVLIESVVYGTLTASDWGLQAKPLCAKICIGTPPMSKVFSANPADGWKSVDMLTAVGNDWEKRVERNYRSGFRLRFEKDCSGPCDYVAGLGIYSGNYTLENRPYLLVTYLHP